MQSDTPFEYKDVSAEAGSDEVTVINRKIAWRVIPLLFICYIVSYLDRINISVAKLQMTGDLHFSNAVYAFGASVFFWGYVLFEVPSNLLLSRFGARVWIARIMITWGLFSAAVAFVEPIAGFLGLSSATVFFIVRCLLGACEAGFFPGVILYLSYWYAPRGQSRVLSGFLLALPVATIIGAPLSGWLLLSMNGAMNFRGWQWMFVIEGLPAVALGLVVLAFLSERPENVSWLTRDQKSLVVDQRANRQAERNDSFSHALRDVRLWILCLIYVLYGTGFYGIAFWLPTIIQSVGVKSTFHIGLFTAVPWAVSAVYMVWHANHARKSLDRRWHTALPILFGGFGIIMSACNSDNLVLSLLFMSIALSGLMGVMTVFWTLPAGFLSGTAAAAGIAVISSIGSLSGILGAFVSSVGLDLTGTMRSGTYILGTCVLLSGLVAVLAPRSLYASGTGDS
ncbi:Putative metabolite transport protein NicT [Paraburkholderia rhynchosiae]|uniref:MFS transporter n=2 Tax=Paraburkholderia rhynchosiae TaxID=487049 RepID=A0A2N7VYI1_9BURK|nr:MFS transporter [Paraburkholderia rhynchosiae]CAB3738755.1 Putative metabolite transport protein NicT [Paraburkholderia rhynchosiae]